MSGVIGLDLSLTSTGVALMKDGEFAAYVNPKTKGKKGDQPSDYLRRFEHITGEVFRFIDNEMPVDLAVIEAPSHGSSFGNPHERAGLWWEIVKGLDDRGIPVAQVAPATRAKFITGDGRAKKDVVLAFAIERYVQAHTPRIPNDDVADALGLADMGSHHLGQSHGALPARSLEALVVVKWPTT